MAAAAALREVHRDAPRTRSRARLLPGQTGKEKKAVVVVVVAVAAVAADDDYHFAPVAPARPHRPRRLLLPRAPRRQAAAQFLLARSLPLL